MLVAFLNKDAAVIGKRHFSMEYFLHWGRKDNHGTFAHDFLFIGGKMLRKNMEWIGDILHIGGVSVNKLKEKYNTPLYIYDQKLFENTAKVFMDKFKSDKFETEIVYASKAFSNLYVLGLVRSLGLDLDVVSGGELFLALKAGINPEKIHFHGNNKLEEEIIMAIENDIGLIIIDNMAEFHLLSRLLGKYKKNMRVLLRINPDIVTGTHKFIQTSNADSKFGLNIRDEELTSYIKEIIEDPNVELEGFHAHIGSQVTKGEFFIEESNILLDFTKKMSDDLGYEFTNINFGGGFGVIQKEEDPSLDLEEFLPEFIKHIEEKIGELGLPIKRVGIEPGRSLINQAGSTLYTVASVKETLEGLPLVFVDGGMSDNIRPSLYGAKYDALIANRKESSKKSYRVAGKLCESGDILIDEVELGNPEKDDLLLIPSTGAYTYAMQSHYNKMLNPAVVFVKDGKDYLAVRRESYEDLLINNLEYEERN